MKKKLTIGVLENDSLNRFIYERMVQLQSDKVEAHIFENHQEGTEKVQTIKPDVLFVDLHMYGEHMGGIEWLKTMKRILPHTKFVAMTTLIRQNDSELAINAGFVKCMEKPLPFHNVEQLLNESMN